MTAPGPHKIMYGAPPYRYRHSVAGDEAAKAYFIHRCRRDRADEQKHSGHHWPDPAFVLMPLRSRSETPRTSNRSNLAHLPGELLLDIFELLAPVDRHSFRTICKYVWMVSVTNRVIGDLDNDDADEHAWRLRKDRFNRFAEYEEANDAIRQYTPRDKLLCSYCMDLHPLSAFGALERECAAIIAKERQCTASAATVYFCPHTQMAFEDFIRLLRSPDQEYQRLVCPQACEPQTTYCKWADGIRLTRMIPVPRVDRETISRPQQSAFAHETCKICNIRRFPGSEAPSEIIKALQDIDVYVCPHVQGKEAACNLLEALSASPHVHPVCKHIISHEEGILMPSVRERSTCESDGCEAILSVILDEFGVMIRVTRELNLLSVMDDNWNVVTQYPFLGTD